MAHAEHDLHVARVNPWDGAVRCTLCGDQHRQVDHDWCPASQSIVCDECCEEVLRGEPRRLIAAAEASPRSTSPLELIAFCTACPRLQRMLVEDDEDESVAAEEEPGSIH